MNQKKYSIVFIGLTITSTWGNGHATTYRGLAKELTKLGHKVSFLERDMPWYASNREFASVPYCDVRLYNSLEELQTVHRKLIRDADIVIVGSYVPEGIAVGETVLDMVKGACAFYDIDTPVTLANIAAGKCEYLSPELISRFDLYLSFTGGPTLRYIEKELGSPCAKALYCSVDPDIYFPEHAPKTWDLGYLGTYAADRQPAVEQFLIEPARQRTAQSFVVAGPQYPADIDWPRNVARIDHLPAAQHRHFYNSQRFTLNLTRQDMVRAGYSPSVRLFEAAAVGTPIITDTWPGLDSVFRLGTEILPVRSANEVHACLQLAPEQAIRIGQNARNRTLKFHTAAVRARELAQYVTATSDRLAGSKKRERVLLRNPEATAVL